MADTHGTPAISSPILLITAYTITFLLLRQISLIIYRIYFSPLSHIPGPKLAAASIWYQFYYDVIKRGRFLWEIERMHKVYGNLTSPHLVHRNINL